MRPTFYILLSVCLLFPSTVHALTWDRIVDTKYVREHSDQLSVTVVEKEQGMMSFTVVLKLKKPRYVVAHMKVRDGSRTLSESHTPIFTRVEKSTFRFSIPRELIGSSTYSVSVSFLNGERPSAPFLGFLNERDGRELVLTPGGTRYLFRLSDFVSPKVSESADVAREFAEAADEPLTIQE